MTTHTTCPGCGLKVPVGTDFCGRCGAALSGERDAQTVPTTPPVQSGGAGTPPASPPSGGAAPSETIARPSIAASAMRNQLDEQALEKLRNATLGEYEILSELGRGGMATVYLAHELALNRKVAIKLISPHLLADNTAERFLREARTAAGLSHPNLIPIHAVRESESLLFFVMKYVAGPSLETLLREGTKLSVPVVQAILSQTAEALGYAHRRMIVHRDVKPGNIMLDDDGRVMVTDFGIARDTQSTGLTNTGMAVGTPMYMSPEQCLGQPVSGASDQYSLGIVGFEMLTGKVPFEAATPIAMMYAHLHTTPLALADARPDCPPHLSAALMRMIEKEPRNRFPSIEDAIKAIAAPPMGPDDPIRRELSDLARVGAEARQRSLPSTPQSPMPATRNFVRGSLRTPGTPGPAVAAPSAPTVRISQPEPHTPVPVPVVQASARKWPVAIAFLALIGVAAWLGIRRPWEAKAPPSVAVVPPSATLTGPPSTQPVVGTAPPPANPPPSGAETPAPPPAPAAAPAKGAKRAVSVAITPAVSQLKVGESKRLTAVPSDAGGREIRDRPVRWTSSDQLVATVSPAGVLEALVGGATVVTATVDGISTKMRVSVIPAAPAPAAPTVAAVEITPGSLDVAQNARGQLKATVRDNTGAVMTDRQVFWSSANPQVADVSNSGVVFAAAPGTAQITATSEGHSASVTVTVPQPLAAAPPPPPPDPTPAIRQLLDDYVKAIHARNVARMKTLYPEMTPDRRKEWANMFDSFSEVDAALVPESIEIDAKRKTVAFNIAMTVTERHEQHKFLVQSQATLRLDGGEWRFDSIEQSSLLNSK